MALQGNFRHTETHSAVSREELMMVLAGLQQLQIRALFSKFSRAVSLRRVALEVASKMGRGPLASNVELCMCPANYLGDSCQVRWGGGRHRQSAPPMHICPPPPRVHSCLPSPLVSPTLLSTLQAPQPSHHRLSQPLAHLSANLSPCPCQPLTTHCPVHRWSESDL